MAAPRPRFTRSVNKVRGDIIRIQFVRIRIANASALGISNPKWCNSKPPKPVSEAWKPQSERLKPLGTTEPTAWKCNRAARNHRPKSRARDTGLGTTETQRVDHRWAAGFPIVSRGSRTDSTWVLAVLAALAALAVLAVLVVLVGTSGTSGTSGSSDYSGY